MGPCLAGAHVFCASFPRGGLGVYGFLLFFHIAGPVLAGRSGAFGLCLEEAKKFFNDCNAFLIGLDFAFLQDIGRAMSGRNRLPCDRLTFARAWSCRLARPSNVSFVWPLKAGSADGLIVDVGRHGRCNGEVKGGRETQKSKQNAMMEGCR